MTIIPFAPHLVTPIVTRLSYRFPAWEVVCDQMDDGALYVAAWLQWEPGSEFSPREGFAAIRDGDRWVITDGNGSVCARARLPDLYATFAAVLEAA